MTLTSLIACGHDDADIRTGQQERCRHGPDSEGTGADLRFPRLCLPPDRPESVHRAKLMKVNSMSHI